MLSLFTLYVFKISVNIMKHWILVLTFWIVFFSQVSINGQNTTHNTKISFQSSLNPTISNVAPTTLSAASSNTIINITGTNFQSTSGDEPEVTINRTPCTVVSFDDTLIRCVAPQLAPGDYKVRVSVHHKGINLVSYRLNNLVE